MRTIRLPRKFYDDHKARDLPTPEPVRENSRSVWVRADDEHLDELRSDADYYSDPTMFDASVRPVCMAARRLLAALDKNG